MRTTWLVCAAGMLLISAIAYPSPPNQAHDRPSQTSKARPGAAQPPSDWRKLDAGEFSVFAPTGWEFHTLQGVDSYVGEFVGDGVKLTFDFGQYSSSFERAKQPVYVITHESIGGFSAKVISPRTPGHGITGVYFGNVGRPKKPRLFGSPNKLSLFAQELTADQQELVLKIFETVRFKRQR